MEDRQQRPLLQMPISLPRVPVDGRGEGASGEQSTSSDSNAASNAQGKADQQTSSTEAKPGTTSTKYGRTADSVLIDTSLPTTDLRTGIPVQEPRSHENIPVIDLRGLVDHDHLHHQQNTNTQSETARQQSAQKSTDEKILRDAHVERLKEDRVEQDTERKGHNDQRIEGTLSTIPKDETPSKDLGNKSIHFEERSTDKNKPATVASFKDEPPSTFRSPAPDIHETKTDLKSASISQDRDLRQTDVTKHVEPTSDVHKQNIPSKDEPKVDQPRNVVHKVEDQKRQSHEARAVQEPTESINSKISKKSDEQIVHRDVTPREIVRESIREEKRSDVRIQEPPKEIHVQPISRRGSEEVRSQPVQSSYKEELPPVRVSDQPKHETKTEVDKPIESQRSQPSIEVVSSERVNTEKVNTEKQVVLDRPERIVEPTKSESPQQRELSLEDRIEKIIVPDISSKEKVITREETSARQEEIIIDKIIRETSLDKEAPRIKEGEEPVVIREALQDRSIVALEQRDLAHEAAGIVVEKEGPNASSSGSGDIPQAIVLEHEALDQIIDHINEVTPTASASEGLVLSEVRGVIGEIIRINDSQLATGREPLPEEISRLEALSDQLRNTLSQAVDELSRKADKTYEEVVLLNELRVLLSELSRDPLLQLGFNIDESTLLEAREVQKPQNMLEEAYEKVKEVVTKLLGFGSEERVPEKQELPPPIIILKDIIQHELPENEELEEIDLEEQLSEEEELESRASRAVHTLSGEILDSATGAGLSGVSVYGGLLGVAITDELGRFSFENVQHGTSFMIGPDKHGYRFSPSVISGTITNSEHYTFIARKVK